MVLCSIKKVLYDYKNCYQQQPLLQPLLKTKGYNNLVI